MNFELPEEHRMLKDLVARFVREELLPLEPRCWRARPAGRRPGLTRRGSAPARPQSRELGLWGLDAPEEIGGSDLPLIAMVAVNEEMGRTIVPLRPAAGFAEPADADAHRDAGAGSRYLEPYARGETVVGDRDLRARRRRRSGRHDRRARCATAMTG